MHAPPGAMPPLQLYTARLGAYRAADGLDITRMNKDPIGVAFAPSWDILQPALHARQRARDTREAGELAAREQPAAAAYLRARAAQEAEEIEAAAWKVYEPAYVEEMRASWREHQSVWLEVARRAEVTLLCACTDTARCHRTVAARLLVKAATSRGIVVELRGEREPPAPAQQRLF